MVSDQACTVVLADCALDINDTVDLCSKIPANCARSVWAII
jgi:hypothetical protein